MATDYRPERADRHDTRDHILPAVVRAPLEGRTWREFGYLMLSLPISIIFFTFAVTAVSLGAGLLITFLGIPVLAAGLAGCRAFGALERSRARGLLRLDVDNPEPLRPRTNGLMSWVAAVLKSGTSWRHLIYALVHFPWAVTAFCIALTFWVTGWSLLACRSAR